MHSLFVVPFVLLLASGPVMANCLQTFNVKADKTATHFGWLPGSAQYGATSMSCVSLEAMRQDYYVASGKAIDVAAFQSAQAYKTETEKTLAKLSDAQTLLQNQIAKDATIDALRITYRVLKYEFGKASTLIGCLSPDPTASKALCAIGLFILADDTSSVLDGSIAKVEVTEGAKKLTKRVEELKAQYAKLKANEVKFDMSAVQKRQAEIFTGMCSTVQTQCL